MEQSVHEVINQYLVDNNIPECKDRRLVILYYLMYHRAKDHYEPLFEYVLHHTGVSVPISYLHHLPTFNDLINHVTFCLRRD